MENKIFELEKQIARVEFRQRNSMNIIRQINLMNEERKYFGLLSEHTHIIDECDIEVEQLKKEKLEYEELLNTYLQYVYSISLETTDL